MRIVILTGAGISQESGLATFRDPDGIWAKYRIEDVATPEAFARDPDRVLEFYTRRRAQLRDPSIQPNAAHLALARLQQVEAHQTLLVTQNVDDLHDRAGSTPLIHMHGELAKTRCDHCGDVRPDGGDFLVDSVCAACGAAGTLRPDVVWFGEMPYQMPRIYDALAAADLFVSIGTSGNVYPAADFVRTARAAGARTVELNLEPSEGATAFAEHRYGPATQLVPDFFASFG